MFEEPMEVSRWIRLNSPARSILDMACRGNGSRQALKVQVLVKAGRLFYPFIVITVVHLTFLTCSSL